MNRSMPLGDASPTATPSEVPTPTFDHELGLLSTPVAKITNINKRHPRVTFSQFRLLVLLLAITVGLSMLRARQTVDSVRVLMQSFWDSDYSNSSYSSVPQFIAAEITPTSTNTSIQTNSTATSSTILREPNLEMSPLPPPPFTMNGTGGIVFFLHIPKTGTYARLYCTAHTGYSL